MAERMVDGIMKSGRKIHQKSAIRMVEEAVYILRSAPVALLSVYYAGGVPFVLGLLYFWADMSRSADAFKYNTMAALGLAFLYVWMKFWHTLFAYQVKTHLFGQLQYPWSLRRIASIAATQCLIQSTRFFVIPIASLMIIPFGYCYAFYQNAAVHDEAEGQKVKSTCRWAWRQAKLWPAQNHLLIGIYWLFGIVIFLNVSMAAVLIPQLIKTLLGVHSMFTLSGYHMILNTTFWIAMLGITYLFLDPFIKTTYVLRCFYGSALQSGDDLRMELSQILTAGKKMAGGLLIMVLCMSPFTSMAAQPAEVAPAELDRSIEEILQQREFTWRLPRDTIRPEEQTAKGPLEAAVEWLIEMLGKGIKKLGQWIKQFVEWLEGLLPRPDKRAETAGGSWITSVRIVLIVLLILLLAVLTYVLTRIWQRRRTGAVETVSASPVLTPDLNDEGLTADDLSTDHWLALAGELSAKGELRLAARALYLATLAKLAEHDLITIEAYKSNREYEQELKRRAHEHKELLLTFSNSLNFFECAWYGMYRIDPADFDGYATDHQRIMAFAEK
jgi:hypothetical protein